MAKKKRTLEEVIAQDNITFLGSNGGGIKVALSNALAGGALRYQGGYAYTPVPQKSYPITVQKSGVTGQANIDKQAAGDAVQQIGNAGCQLLTNPLARAACVAGTGVLATTISGKATDKSGNIKPSQTQWFDNPALAPSTCPPGQVQILGKCVDPTAALPGGQPMITPAGGPSGGGMMGMPAFQPTTFYQSRLACPKRYVLAVDDLCYPKGFVPRSLRKWVPQPRPLLSAMDGKILNRAKSVQKKLRRVAGKHVPKPRTCKPRGKK